MNLHSLIILSIFSLSVAYQSFENYQVFRLMPQNKAQLYYLHRLALNQTLKHDSLSIDFWTEPIGINKSIDILLSYKARQSLIPILKNRKIKHEVLINNVQNLIENGVTQLPELDVRSTIMSKENFFRGYQRFDTIMKYLEHLTLLFPNLVRLETIGHSVEGRQLQLVILSNKLNTFLIKKKVWLDAGTHAREWIGPSTCLYILTKLLEDAESDKKVMQLLDMYEFYFVPIVNPDGYEYTHTTNRMWRKNRSKNRIFWVDSYCVGTDLNRNWDFHWKEKGASHNPCSDIYAGPRPFSEKETKALSNYIMKHEGTWGVYLSLHSYSQLILMPWGYTSQLPENYPEMERVARLAAEQMALRGTLYKVGSSTRILYAAAGGSDDWAHGRAKIKYSYTIELRDTGEYGFLLPPSQISSTGEETFEAFKEILMNIEK